MKKPELAVFFVSEDEYPKLQALFPQEFTLPYSEYAEFIEQRNREVMKDLTIIKTYANVDAFVSWCTASKISPDPKARGAYATFIHTTSP